MGVTFFLKREKQSNRATMLFSCMAVWSCLFPGADAAKIGAHRPITASDLVTIRDIGGHHYGAVSASPDGRYVAFQLQTPNLESRTYDLSWRVIETKPNGRRWTADDNGGEPILNPNGSPTPVGYRPPMEAQWSPGNEWIYYLKKRHGDTQIWRSHKNGSASEQLTHNAADILSFQLSDGGDKLFFTTAIPDEELAKKFREEADRGFLYDERFHPDKQLTPLARTCSFEGRGRGRIQDTSQVSTARACKPALWVYDIVMKTERIAKPAEVEVHRRHSGVVPLWSTDSDRYLINEREDKSIIWLVNEDPKKFPGYRPPMRLFASLGGEEFRCPVMACSGLKGVMEGAWWKPGADEVIFLRAVGASESMTGLYAWEPSTGQVRAILRTEDKLSDCEILENRAICLREQWTHPRTIVSIGLDNGETETIYDPNLEFNDFKFSRIEKIEWEDQFGNPTHGHLVYPLNYEPGRRYPLVITTYSSRGFLRGAVGDEYPIHVLAANGFMVLSNDEPNRLERDAVVPYPGQAEFEDNYERRSTLSAQERILDRLDKRGLIDPERVAITGLSDGEAQVIFAITHTKHFAAAIASSARDHRSRYYFYGGQERAYWRRIFGGAPYGDNNGLYKALSLGLNAEKVKAPLLVNVSDHELLQSVESFVRLQDAGKPVEMYVFPNEYHNKWQPQHRLAIYRRNVQWLKFWLMGEEVDDPVDPEQYPRWRVMRDEQCARLHGDYAPWYCRQ